MAKTIGILTAGGDSPGLNAAIRGVGKAAIGAYGMHVVGFRDGFRGLMENRGSSLDAVRPVRHPDDRRHHSRHQPGQAEPHAGRQEDHGHDRCDRRDLPQASPGRAGLPGRRRHAEERLPPAAARPERDHPAQDDRQRRRADRRQLRVRHRARDRHRRDRPPAQHRAQPPPHHRGRGDGPQRRLAGARRRDRGRRRRHPDPGDPLRQRGGRRGDPPPQPDRQPVQHRGGVRRRRCRASRPRRCSRPRRWSSGRRA